MRILILFIFLISNSFANEATDIKNLVINKKLIKHDGLVFLDHKNEKINLNDYNGSLILLNFWATWCAPCREEMPSLDLLQSDIRLNNLKIFPINIGQEDSIKSETFFNELNIKNLNPYFDPTVNLAKKFSLRGIPTTILIDKEGKAFARIIGSINFEDEKFINWLKNFN